MREHWGWGPSGPLGISGGPFVLAAIALITLVDCSGAEARAPPVAAFSATPTQGPAPLTVRFTDESTGEPDTWVWDFGDGTQSSLQSPEHVYSTAGDFTVVLTVSNEAGVDDEIKLGCISVTTVSNHDPVQITDNTWDDWQPTWADASTLYYAANKDGHFNIYSVDIGGGAPTARTQFTECHTDMPAVDTPFLYYRSCKDGDWDIYRSSGPGNEVAITRTPEKDFEVAVAPDLAPYRVVLSRAEAFNGGTIWNIYGYGSTGLEQVSDTHADFHPTCSPNGQRVAYMYKFGDWDPGQILVVSIHGGDTTLITDPEENCAYPTWNWVYDKIAYTRSAEGRRNVFAVDPDGANEVQLTHSPYDIVYPAWSPDGRHLAYAAFSEGDYELYVVEVEPSMLNP